MVQNIFFMVLCRLHMKYESNSFEFTARLWIRIRINFGSGIRIQTRNREKSRIRIRNWSGADPQPWFKPKDWVDYLRYSSGEHGPVWPAWAERVLHCAQVDHLLALLPRPGEDAAGGRLLQH